ncbi:MAG: sulfotransferase [Proteobacteria bacterium]|nr:sulfotransferase [Pseudomonadota bacterium]
MPAPLGRPLLMAAIDAVQRRDLDRAESLFRKHVQQMRDDVPGLADYGDFCVRTGRFPAAIYLLRKAISLGGGEADDLAQLGFAQLEVGQSEAAHASFGEAIRIAPRHAMARYGAAQCHQLRREPALALPHLEVASQELPGHLLILLNLAEAQRCAGHLERAGASYERAERLAPGNEMLQFERAKFFRATNRVGLALELLEGLVRRGVREPVVLLELVAVRRLSGNVAGALKMLAEVERIDHAMPELHQEIGNCHDDLGDSQRRALHWGFAVDLLIRNHRLDEARELLDRLLAANPGYETAWNLLGMMQEAAQQFDAALESFRKADQINPRWLDAAANQANLLELTNRVDEAGELAFVALCRVDDDLRRQSQACATLHLVAARVARRNKDLVQTLSHLAKAEEFPLDTTQRRLVWFERGRVHDLAGDPDSAMVAFAEGNRMARVDWERSNQPDKYSRWVDIALAQARAGTHRDWLEVSGLRSSQEPAFLVGFPRSGTTLINQVLDCHPQLQTIEEREMVADVFDCLRHMPESYPDSLRVLDRWDVEYLRATYFKTAAKYCTLDPERQLVDKLPLNLVKAMVLHRVFPNARYILAIRHPCDAVLSCFIQDFRINDAMASFFTLPDTVSLYVRAMETWNIYQRDLGLRFHRIRYEDVVDDFEGEVRALCGFLGVAWMQELERFSERAMSRRRIYTPSYEQVSQPIYRQARYRWERYRKYLEPFLPALRPYILQFGYEDPLAKAS